MKVGSSTQASAAEAPSGGVGAEGFVLLFSREATDCMTNISGEGRLGVSHYH